MHQRKLIIIFSSMVIAMTLLVVRIGYLQLIVGARFSRQSILNTVRTELLKPPRGNIIDNNGVLLATNRPVFDLYWQGSGCYTLRASQQLVIDSLDDILDGEIKIILSKIARAEHLGQEVCLATDLTMHQIGRISEQCGTSHNIEIRKNFARVYPQGEDACHIIGYLSRADARGASGLEKLLHHSLTGVSGHSRYITRAGGQRVQRTEHVPPQAGDEIRLTIDMRLQHLAQKLLRPFHGGVCIVMDPFDGKVLVMASHPTYNPNIFLGPISEQLWQDTISQPSPFLNRTIHAQYPPASLYKVITIAAGLEEKIITAAMTCTCEGSLYFCGRNYYCWQRQGHGNINHIQALAQSCNIHCYEIAKQLSIDQLSGYAQRFGLGEEVGFLLQEKSGLMPTNAWKRSTKGENWWQGETLSAAIGQSFLLVTPLQIARMFGAIATGYLVTPHIIADDEYDFSFLGISRSTLRVLRRGMRQAVRNGTAWRLRDLSDYQICAKTGTAQIENSSQATNTGASKEHGWFVGYASYKGQPPLVIVVLTEHTGASREALMIAKKFLTGYAHLQDQSNS